jgi:hypothetical protein
MTTGMLLCASLGIGCQSTATMQRSSATPVAGISPACYETVEETGRWQSPYHLMSTPQLVRAERAADRPVGAVARAQKPEVLPPPSTGSDPLPGPGPAALAPAGPVAGPGVDASPELAGPPDVQLSLWQRCKKKMQAKWCGYAEEFIAPPLGHWAYEHGRTQVANGEAARMVLYHYDFEQCGARLTLRGRDQLAKMEEMLPQNFFPIVIERTPNMPGLAEARRLGVLQELSHGSFPVPPERVVIGPPLTPGLRGVEAEVINRSLMYNTRIGGAPLPPSQDVGVSNLYVPGGVGTGPAGGLLPQ